MLEAIFGTLYGLLTIWAILWAVFAVGLATYRRTKKGPGTKALLASLLTLVMLVIIGMALMGAYGLLLYLDRR